MIVSKVRHVVIWAIVFGMMSVSFLSSAQTSGPVAEGVVAAIKNDVRAYRNPKQKPAGAKQVKLNNIYYDDIILTKQSPVYAGDVIVTLPGSHVRLILNKGDVIVLGPQSNIEIKTTKPKTDGAAPSADVSMNLLYGKVRSIINKTQDGTPRNVRVTSPNAVAGIRGTDFYTEFDLLQQQTKVAPLHGTVELANVPKGVAPADVDLSNSKEKVSIPEGKESVVETPQDAQAASLPPTPPKVIQPSTITNATFISSFKHQPKPEAEEAAKAAGGPTVDEAQFEKLDKLGQDAIQVNTAHLKLEKGQDPLTASAKKYETTLQKIYKNDPPLNERIFNWMKNSL